MPKLNAQLNDIRKLSFFQKALLFSMFKKDKNISFDKA